MATSNITPIAISSRFSSGAGTSARWVPYTRNCAIAIPTIAHTAVMKGRPVSTTTMTGTTIINGEMPTIRASEAGSPVPARAAKGAAGR